MDEAIYGESKYGETVYSETKGMDEYYVRIYHMKDGSTVVPHAVYALEEQAIMALDRFNPNGNDGKTPEEDMGQVSYVTIEKRYAPAGSYWSAEESQHHSVKRAQKLMDYLDRLATLKAAGHSVTSELQATLAAIHQELGLEVYQGSKMNK